MFEIFKSSKIDTVGKFVSRTILWVIFILIAKILFEMIFFEKIEILLQAFLHILKIQNKLITSILTIILNTLCVFLILRFIKKSNYYLATSFFLIFIIIPSTFILFPALGFLSHASTLLNLASGLTRSYILTIFGIFYTAPFIIIFTVFAGLIINIQFARFGYFTQKNLNKFGYIIYRILLIAVIAVMAVTILSIKYLAEPSNFILIICLILRDVVSLTTLFLIPYDIQKIKNLSLDAIKKNDAGLKYLILLCALVLYFDFTASWMRVLIPWGWKKE